MEPEGLLWGHGMIKKLWEWGFMGNVWAWFHIMGGGICAKFLSFYIDKWNALLFVFLITILWEVFEFVKDGGKQGMIDIYGSLERWAYDSAGDILGANLMALIVIL